MLNLSASLFVGGLLFLFVCLTAGFGIALGMDVWVIFASLFVLVMIVHGSILGVYISAAVFNLLFVATYTPIFGFFLGLNESLDPGLLRMAIGSRSVVFSALVILVLFKLFIVAKQVRLSILATVVLLVIGLLLNPEFSAVVYLLNSFLPFFGSLIVLQYLLLRLSSRHNYLVELFAFGGRLRTTLSPFYILVAMIFLFGFASFLSYVFLYELVRPDLVTMLRTREGLPITYGEFPAYWYTVFYDFRFLRFSGGFPDAIVYGYFCAFLSFLLYTTRHYIWSSVVVVLLLLAFSKGALLFIFQAATLMLLRRFGILYLLFGVITFVSIQLVMANVLDTSASVHLEGLLGGLKSMLTNGPVSLFIGHGMGQGGNLERLVVGGRDAREAWLASGSESAIGVLAYQFGLAGLALFIYLVWRIVKMAEFVRLSGYGIYSRYIQAGILSLSVNMFLQETLLNASIIGVLILFAVVGLIPLHSQSNRKFPVEQKGMFH